MDPDTYVDVAEHFPTDQKLQISMRLLENLHSHVRVADEKLRVLFAASALLAAALAFNPQQTLGTLAAGNATPLAVALVLGRVGLLGAIAVSVISAVLALLPRVQLPKVERSLFFFGSIGDTDHRRFIDEFGQLTPDQALTQVLSQVHVNALIVREKYKWTYRAAVWFIVAVSLLIVVQLLALLT